MRLFSIAAIILILMMCASCVINTITPIVTFKPDVVNLFLTGDMASQTKKVKINVDAIWELRYDARWLKVAPQMGKENQDVTVSITGYRLKSGPGEYRADIQVNRVGSHMKFTLPVYLNIVKEKPGQILDIPIEIVLDDISPGATEFSNLTATVSVLKEDAFSLTGGGWYEAGDPCIIITGEVKNNTDNETVLGGQVEGFDTTGLQRGWCLSQSYLVGTFGYNIPAHSSIKIVALLSWSSMISEIKLNTGVWDGIVPLPEN
jgi:hypothetical protein